jgi:hypothetical protein
MRSEILMAVNVKIMAFYSVMPCSSVNRYQRLVRTGCLHLQGRRISHAGRNGADPGMGQQPVNHWETGTLVKATVVIVFELRNLR